MEHKYPSMDNYYKSVGDMLGDPVVISEKLDGSNFSVRIFWNRTKTEWDIEYRSRNQAVNTRADGLFFQAIKIAESLQFKFLDLLTRQNAIEIVLYFEVIGRGIQKRINYLSYFEGLDYPQFDGRTIALLSAFVIHTKNDNFNPVDTEWLGIRRIQKIAEYLGVYQPLWFRVEKLSLIDIEKLLEQKDIEGYVITSEIDGQIQFTHYGDLKRVKLKTNWFNSFEKKGTNKRAKPKTPPEIIKFLMDRINFGRLHSIYSHGNDNLVHEMKDMRYLIDLVIEDIKAEDDSLWENFDAVVIKKTCGRMLPNVLQGYLLERNI